MNDVTPPAANPGHDPLRLRHVLTIVLAGAALGVGFNALQLSAGSPRALAWVKSERRVVSLDGLSRPPAAAPAETALPVAVTPPPAAGSPRPAAAHAREAAANGAAKGFATPATPAAPAKAVTPAPAPAAAVPRPPAASTSVPGVVDLPVIPDSRDPIEAGLEVVRKLHAAGAALFLDARSAGEYAEGHIADAVSLPFDDVYRNPALAKSVEAKGRVIVTYCGGGDCDLSRSLAFSLIDAGSRKVLVFTGGLPAWAAAGGAVRKGVQP